MQKSNNFCVLAQKLGIKIRKSNNVNLVNLMTQTISGITFQMPPSKVAPKKDLSKFVICNFTISTYSILCGLTDSFFQVMKRPPHLI